jgi:hypothetical protein
MDGRRLSLCEDGAGDHCASVHEFGFNGLWFMIYCVFLALCKTYLRLVRCGMTRSFCVGLVSVSSPSAELSEPVVRCGMMRSFCIGLVSVSSPSAELSEPVV